LLWVDIVFFHAAFKQPDDVSVVWILSKTQTSAVVHELLEFFGLVLAELLDLDFLLLFLDVGILLGLRSSWESLPWK
jgi:hypothetical protein